MTSNKVIDELTQKLYEAHEDYGEGRTQDFGMVTYHCKQAADLILQMEEALKIMTDKGKQPTNERYVAGKYECWDVAKELCEGKEPWEAVLFFNVFKYIWRYPWKNGVEDLIKAKNYSEKLINELSVKKAN